MTLPANGQAGVDAHTEFQWSGRAPVFRLEVASTEDCSSMNVVTSRKEVSLPVAPRSSYVMSPNTKFNWQVSTSGSLDSVDEAANVAGYNGPFQYGLPHGMDRVVGSLTVSERSHFVSAP